MVNKNLPQNLISPIARKMIDELNKKTDGAFVEATRKAVDDCFRYFAYGIPLPEDYAEKLESEDICHLEYDYDVEIEPRTGHIVECEHVWKPYLGLNETFEYCEICDKRKD